MIQHRTVLITFLVILHTIIIAEMLSTGGSETGSDISNSIISDDLE